MSRRMAYLAFREGMGIQHKKPRNISHDDRGLCGMRQFEYRSNCTSELLESVFNTHIYKRCTVWPTIYVIIIQLHIPAFR